MKSFSYRILTHESKSNYLMKLLNLIGNGNSANHMKLDQTRDIDQICVSQTCVIENDALFFVSLQII